MEKAQYSRRRAITMLKAFLCFFKNFWKAAPKRAQEQVERKLKKARNREKIKVIMPAL